MPIGIQRLNNPHEQPSSQIIFIKPLPGPDEKYAKDFLERIAAICHPIMKANHLSIMTLEEHEPNREFVGRNFNAGEIIQLVLKSQSTGRWLSFRTVQLVMIHELAHCQQMNHSRNFWNVRNQYAVELRELWQKRYTGDGLWGRGRTLLSGAYDTGGSEDNDVLPKHLCGGAYRNSRRRKRKARVPNANVKTETHAEKKQRRLAKRFGVSGNTLGGDLDQRVKLEYGQINKAKPKVASSARGRELRVAAALARFEAQKAEPAGEKSNDLSDDTTKSAMDSSTDDESDGAGDFSMSAGIEDHMIKVCGDDDMTDVNVKQEMDEIRGLTMTSLSSSRPGKGVKATDAEEAQPSVDARSSDLQRVDSCRKASSIDNGVDTTDEEDVAVDAKEPTFNMPNETEERPFESDKVQTAVVSSADRACPICSMSNETESLRCMACLHVLDTAKVPDSWKCHEESCSADYINAGDCNLCGVCGRRRPTPAPP